MKQCEVCMYHQRSKLIKMAGIKMCAECAETYKPRKCQVCNKHLTPNRYFNCEDCIPEMETDSGSLDYFEDVGF